MAAPKALRRWNRRFFKAKTAIGAQGESLPADPQPPFTHNSDTARRNPLAVPTAIQERHSGLMRATVDRLSPLSDQETRKLLDRLNDIDESVAKTFAGLLRPKDGWWPVVAKTDDPLYSKVLSYMCQPADALTHVVDTNFAFDLGDGAPYINGSSERPDGGPEYRAIGSQGIVPIAYFCKFGEGAPSDWTSLELAEDFRLFWLLYEEPKTGEWKRVDGEGEIETVARRVGNSIEVKLGFLTRYLAARQLALVGQAFCDREGPAFGSFTEKKEHCAGGPHHHLHVSASSTGSGGKARIWAYAKRVLMPGPMETCEVWPFEPERSYSDFIVGVNEADVRVLHSCNPSALSTYSVDTGAPHFLTSIHFRLSVLDKYYLDTDRFTVSESCVWGPTWTLSIDHELSDRVIAYLGDLGRLPSSEQQHWKLFNIDPKGSISESAYRRDFEGEFAEPTGSVARMHAARDTAQQEFTERFGVPLFSQPHDDEKTLGSLIRIPSNDSIGAFDREIIMLAKYSVDLLNEAGIASAFLTKPKEKDIKGIKKLEILLAQHQLDDQLTSVLREIYGARTHSAAHRKSTGFDRSLLLAGAPSFPQRFEQLVLSLVAGYDALANACRTSST